MQASKNQKDVKEEFRITREDQFNNDPKTERNAWGAIETTINISRKLEQARINLISNASILDNIIDTFDW